MPTVRTNLLRIDFNPHHYLYELEIIAQCPIEQHHHPIICNHLQQTLSSAIYSHPHLFSPTPLPTTTLHTHLPNGQPITLQFTLCQSQSPVNILAPLLAQQLLLLTKLLYSPELQACFNPFQERTQRGIKKMPGWQLGVELTPKAILLSIAAVQLELLDPALLSEESEVLLDYDTGKFFLKQNIVRIDKPKGQVYFRNGAFSRRTALHPLRVLPLNGYPLAFHLHSLLSRLKSCSQLFCQAWNIKFDSRFLDVTGDYLSVGSIKFRENTDHSLGQLVTPMSSSNFTYNYSRFFNAVKFDDVLKGSLTFFIEEAQPEEPLALKKQIQQISKRMALEVTCKTIIYKNMEHLQQLLTIVSNQHNEELIYKISIIFHHKSKDKSEKDNLDLLLQTLINYSLPFHLVPTDTLDLNQIDRLSYYHLSIIYTKLRLNPWRLNNIPFMNQPMMLISLHIQPTSDKLHSVAMVGTMNPFFTKFTAVQKVSTLASLSLTVSQCLLECIDMFNSIHKRYPQRIFLIRNDHQAEQELNLSPFHQDGRAKGSLLTYVSFYNGHGIRWYNQIDSNYLSKDSVKKVQLMFYTTINQNIYLQMELERPPHRVKICPIERNDPNFTVKVLELLSKAVLGGVGHSYGSGLGILDYPKKLNQYRQLNLSKWSGSLRQGLLMFL